MQPLFLQSWAKPLLVLHALVAVAILGALTHQSVVGVRLLQGNLALGRLARIYAQVVGATFLAAFALGLLMYPHYRYHVRGLYLDRYEPWASNLFDMKENLAALGLPVAVALYVLGRRFEPARQKALVPVFAALTFLLWAVVAFSVVSGLLVTQAKGT